MNCVPYTVPGRGIISAVFPHPFFLLCLLYLLFMSPPLSASLWEEDSGIDFTALSLEELKNVKITSASKTPEKISDIPAAVFVVTRDDIRRSGATSIPEALRLAPGVQVARISATEWAVNIRGLNELFSNKLLVLVDGRSVYTHVYSGVFWDIQDTVLEDIERIEIIRGPGAALWGANAVNGVISIITRHAQKTRGFQFSALGGNEEGAGSIRYGDRTARGTYYRIYAKYFSRGSLLENDRDIRNDPSKGDWRSGRLGFRADRSGDRNRNRFSLQGEIYSSRFQNEISRAVPEFPWTALEKEVSRAWGGHLLSRWEHRFSETSDTALQFYYDHYDKDFDGSNVQAHTLDLDFQHRLESFAGHELIWGTDLRYIRDHFQDRPDIRVEPNRDGQYFYSLFLQDKIRLLPQELFLTLGAKFEHNSYTGWEIQPSARILWSVAARHSLWAALSRAVRVPSRVENAGVLDTYVFPSENRDAAAPLPIRIRGSSGLDAESLLAWEIGYRFQSAENFWFAMTAYYHDYDHLLDYRYDENPLCTEDDTACAGLPLIYANNTGGESYGIEMTADWQVLPLWRLQATYTFLETATASGRDTEDPLIAALRQGSNPRNQFSLRSSLDMGRDWELDIWFRYVDRLSDSDVDEYISLDIRLAWQIASRAELSVVGQNLLEPDHAEFSSLKVERSYYCKVLCYF
ncbi:MAG: TonB-dependent receptor [Desulfococcaceae bacterium]|jgi:iron complex outermembrane receptor protein|nr:TonB-dependent receptor [Desulfococcaceae bacterium]